MIIYYFITFFNNKKLIEISGMESYFHQKFKYLILIFYIFISIIIFISIFPITIIEYYKNFDNYYFDLIK
jgi:hypothetical protein